jgi:heme-degrading monooxygenase HmoA
LADELRIDLAFIGLAAVRRPPFGGAILIEHGVHGDPQDGADMIARIWHGRTPASKADAYVDYLKISGIRELEATPGNRGVFVLRCLGPREADFLVVSLWDSMDAVRAFAGADLGKARYFDEDREFLLEFEPNVTHYEVPVAPARL